MVESDWNEYDIYEGRDISSRDDVFFLSMFSDFEKEGGVFPQIRYEDSNSEELIRLRKKFGIDRYYESEDEIRYICFLKKKAVDLLSFKGKELEDHRYDIIDPIDIVQMAKMDGFSLNCRYKTYLFTLMALAVGFKARMVSCMSMDLRYCGCHWVTEIYSNKYSKWIVVDVPMDFFYFDEKGIPLNLLEMRQRIIENRPIKMLSTNKRHIQYAQDYWKIYAFRFKFLSVNSSDFFRMKEKEFFYLNPKGFKINDKKYKDNESVSLCSYYYNAEGIW